MTLPAFLVPSNGWIDSYDSLMLVKWLVPLARVAAQVLAGELHGNQKISRRRAA